MADEIQESVTEDMSEETEDALQSKRSGRKHQAIDDTGCEHDWQAYDPDRPKRRQCRLCKTLAYIHKQQERAGAPPILFCCSYTKMFRNPHSPMQEKRRPGCTSPAVAWYGDTAYCEDHIPTPRACSEAQALRERVAEEAYNESKKESDMLKRAAEIAVSPRGMLTHIPTSDPWPEIPPPSEW